MNQERLDSYQTRMIFRKNGAKIMSALEPLYSLIEIDPNMLSKEEAFILEAILFTHICNILKDFFRDQYKDYFRLIKFSMEMEDAMLDANFICFIIKDILLTEEYTLSGIANYTLTPEEVVYEVAIGCNTSPSAFFVQRIIELHRSVRPDLYNAIIKKIAEDYLKVA